MKSKSEIKAGVMLSYALMLFNVIYGLISTPFILSYVGESSYGVYKAVLSISASMAIMDFGLGTTLTRYMAKYNAENNLKQANNFAGMVFGQYVLLACLVALVGTVLFFLLNKIYGATFSDTQLILAKKLLVFLVLSIILRMLENLLIGIASGFEKFTVANGVRFLTVFTKFLLILVFLPITKDTVTIAILDNVVALLAIVFLGFYITKKIGIKPKFRSWDLSVFKESFLYTVLMFIQSITVQFNGNVDNVLIGAQIGVESVTVYSMSLLVFTMYEGLSSSISTIMLPNMAKRVAAGQTSEQLQSGVEKAGKFQFMLLAAAIGGFVVLGKDFFWLWLGDGFEDCYYLTLILIVPITFPMIQNVSISILRAQNKMTYRTVTLVISCLINIVITYFGIKFYGVWGAAVGTAVSTISNLIFMSIYYHKKLNFKIFKMFFRITYKVLPCAAISTLITYGVHCFINTSWIAFMINIVVFVATYGIALMLLALNKDEKRFVFGRFLNRR